MRILITHNTKTKKSRNGTKKTWSINTIWSTKLNEHLLLLLFFNIFPDISSTYTKCSFLKVLKFIC